MIKLGCARGRPFAPVHNGLAFSPSGARQNTIERGNAENEPVSLLGNVGPAKKAYADRAFCRSGPCVTLLAMSEMEGKSYNGYVVHPRSFELQDGGYSLDVRIERHTGAGIAMQQFSFERVFETPEDAAAAGYQLGARVIDGDIPGLTI